MQAMQTLQSNNFQNSIKICKETAQAEITDMVMESNEDIQFIHMFDSRWSPGIVSDEQLEKYLSSCTSTFEVQVEWAPDSEVENLAKRFKDLKVPIGESTELKEIFMSILHFSQYSISDALKLSSKSFLLIVDKLAEEQNIRARLR